MRLSSTKVQAAMALSQSIQQANPNPPDATSFVSTYEPWGDGSPVLYNTFYKDPEDFFHIINGTYDGFGWAGPAYAAFHSTYLLPQHIVSGGFSIPHAHCARLVPLLTNHVNIFIQLATNWTNPDGPDWYKDRMYELNVICKPPTIIGSRMGVLKSS